MHIRVIAPLALWLLAAPAWAQQDAAKMQQLILEQLQAMRAELNTLRGDPPKS